MTRIVTTVLMAALWCAVPRTAAAGPLNIDIGSFSGGRPCCTHLEHWPTG